MYDCQQLSNNRKEWERKMCILVITETGLRVERTKNTHVKKNKKVN